MYPVDFLYEGNDESPNPDIRKILKNKEKKMSEYQLQIKQIVDYPRCRIYRQFRSEEHTSELQSPS